MTIQTGLSALCFCVLMDIVGGTQVQSLPNATEGLGGFGLPDQSGGRLLLMPALARPELLKVAICGDGRRVPVQFEHRQTQEGAGDGRQTSANFERLPGSVFTVAGTTLHPGAPCFLAGDTLLKGSAVLSIAAPEGSGACLQRGQFARLRDCQVVHCWPLARMGRDKQLALLEFDRRGTDALASLVVVDETQTMFADLPAEFRGAGRDLWRVDDGGVLGPDGVRVVCALQRGRWYTLGIAWSGAEGQSLSLWISDGTARFTKVISDYWYQAPS